MDLRNLAMAQLAFLTLWTTVCGPLSGFTMGLFFLVYQDGRRKGVLPPQISGRWLPSWNLSRSA